MNLNLFSKTYIGSVTFLLFLILLSLSNSLDFFVYSSLGRLILVLFVLFISYTNHILGVVSVLFIILMINNVDFMKEFTSGISQEGYENEEVVEQFTTGEDVDEMDVDMDMDEQPDYEAVEQDVDIDMDLDVNDNSADVEAFQTIEGLGAVENIEDITTEKAYEGFDIVSKERKIQKGVQSNSIPVNEFMKETVNISPHEKSSFLDSFSLY